MPKDEKKAWQGKIFSEIAGHLKNYPFLLIALAAIVALSLIVAFDIEKLKTIKTLLMVMIVLPIACQFIIEFTKLLKGEKEQKAAPPQVGLPPEDTTPEKERAELFHKEIKTAPTPVTVKKKVSALAIISFVLVLFVLGAIGNVISEDTVDAATALGAFVLSSVSLLVALLAMISIKVRKSRGRILALIDFVLSAILVLASIGMFMDAEDYSIPDWDSTEPGGGTATIYLFYAGDQEGCELNLGFEIDGQIVTPTSNPFPVSGLNIGQVYYEIGGTIECPVSGSCVAAGVGYIFIEDGATYNLFWQSVDYGTCLVELLSQ